MIGPAANSPLRPALVTIVGVLLVLFARRPESFLHPQFWAEDASIFYLQADFMGPSALIQSYGGYHDLLLRLLAATAATLDPLWIPAAFFWSSLTVVVAVTLALFSPRLELPHRPWLALAVVLVPHTGEVFHSLTNAQWVSALGLVLLLLVRDPERGWQWISDGLAAALLGLTGVFSILLVPLFLARAVVRLSRAAWLLAAIITTAAVTQVVALLHTVASPPTGSSSLFEIVRTLGHRVWASLLLPPALAGSVSAGVLAGAGVLATTALAVAGPRRAGPQSTRLMLWGCFAAVFAGMVYKLRGELWVLTYLGNGDRYFFPAQGAGPLAADPRMGPTLAMALLASLAAFRFIPFINYDWPAWAAKIRANEPVVVPINPEGSTFTHPGHPQHKPGANR